MWHIWFVDLFFFSSIPGQNIGTTTFVQNSITPCPLRAPLVVVFVGLPCRGKSLAAHKIARHLCWKGEYAKGTWIFFPSDFAPIHVQFDSFTFISSHTRKVHGIYFDSFRVISNYDIPYCKWWLQSRDIFHHSNSLVGIFTIRDSSNQIVIVKSWLLYLRTTRYWLTRVAYFQLESPCYQQSTLGVMCARYESTLWHSQASFRRWPHELSPITRRIHIRSNLLTLERSWE